MDSKSDMHGVNPPLWSLFYHTRGLGVSQYPYFREYELWYLSKSHTKCMVW